MRSYGSLFMCFFFLFATQLVFSQRIETGKTTIRSYEEFTIRIQIPRDSRKELKSFLFPEIQDFAKLKTTYTDDKASRLFTITQSYTPLHSGKFKVNRFSLQVGEQVISFPGTTVTVLTSTKKRKPIPEEEKIVYKSKPQEIYLTVAADKNSVFTGEGLTISVYLMVGDKNETGFNFFDLHNQLIKISRRLTIDNCLIDESSPGIIEQLKFDSISSGTRSFRRLKLFEEKIYPLNDDDLKFPSIEYKLLRYLTAKEQNDILWKAEEVKLVSKPLKITVKSLPDHPLKDKVAVGSFQLKEHISSGKATTGQSVKYVFTIAGTGNISSVLPPEIKPNDLFEVYAPEIIEHGSGGAKTRTGFKSFTYQLIPKEPGQYLLADYFHWIYFNPSLQTYDTLQSRMHLTVSGESQKNKEISSTDLGSFYELAGKESNRLRSKEKDQSIKFLANIIILFMLVTTAILIFRR